MHDVTIWQALLVGLWAGIAAIDQFNGLTHIHRPIVTGAVIGIILGQPTTGIITGGTLELVWAGMVPLAGAQPPNVVIGGVIGTLFAILSGLSPTTAVGVAVPFSVAVQALITLLFTGMAPVAHAMDVAGLNGDTKRLDWMAWIEPAILFVGFFIMDGLPAGIVRSKRDYASSQVNSALDSRRVPSRRRYYARRWVWDAAEDHVEDRVCTVLCGWFHCRGVSAHGDFTDRAAGCGLRGLRLLR